MNPNDKFLLRNPLNSSGSKSNRHSNIVINGVKISKAARDLASSCLLHHGIDLGSPNCDTSDGGVIPMDKFMGAIHELANNSRITNDALVKAIVEKAGTLEGVTEEALNSMMSLAQHSVDNQVSAELTLESLQLLTGKLDTQFKVMLKIKNKIDHLRIDQLADDLDKLAQAVSNPNVAKLIGLED